MLGTRSYELIDKAHLLISILIGFSILGLLSLLERHVSIISSLKLVTLFNTGLGVNFS